MWKYYALLAAFFAALTAIFSKVGVRDIDSSLATAIRVVFVLILTWSTVFITGSQHYFFSIPGKTWLFLFLSAVATGFSWLCYFRALQTGPVAVVAPLDKLSVPLTIVLAAIFLGESLSWQTICGGILITLGAIILII